MITSPGCGTAIAHVPGMGKVYLYGSWDPLLKISVDGKIYEFELHPYCGPTLLNKKGDPRPPRAHPRKFLKACSLWNAQGRRMEEGLCRWDHDPEPILKHLGGRHWECIGEHPPRRGE